MNRLCIDAGHGTGNKKTGVYDGGASAGGLVEAEIALEWALTLKHVLSGAGIAFWLTRAARADAAPVGTRASRAKAAGCSHLLSIHCNAGPAAASGIETFYRTDLDRGFAKVVHAAALESLGPPDRGIRHESQTNVGRLAVMNFAGPCALLELGYITNPRDRVVLASRDHRLAFAQALAGRLAHWRA